MIVGGPGRERVYAGGGDDAMRLDAGADRAWSGAGRDLCLGGRGFNFGNC